MGANPSYIRALLASGGLEGEKVGGRWLIEPLTLERRMHLAGKRGRQYTPSNAWAALCLASGLDAEWVDPSARSRIRRALREKGLRALQTKLVSRAHPRRFFVHPGEIKRLAERSDLQRAGPSASRDYRLGLVVGLELDAYVDERRVKEIAAKHALEPMAGIRGNVVLRAVPSGAWGHIRNFEVAPRAAVALDLDEDADPRTARLGHRLLKEIDQQLRGGQLL